MRNQKTKVDCHRKRVKKICWGLSSVMVMSQAVCHASVWAADLEYEGVTQIAANSYYLDADTFASEFKVEEVYAQSGSRIGQGDQILKLTEESYEKAVDYYSAAIIRAENQLADVQLDYDQGILESQYTYETAQVKAEQAEAVKEYQLEELADTITDHEEVLEEIDERVAELEAGMADGSYDSGSLGGSGGSGESGGSGSSSGGSKSGFPSGEEQPEAMTEVGRPETGESEPETESPQTQETDQENGENAGETETPPTENGNPDTQPETEGEAEEKEQELASLQSRIESKNAEYQEVVEKIEGLGFALSGTGDEAGNEAADEKKESAGTAEEQLQISIDGDTNVKTNLENVQSNLSSVPEAVMEVVKAAYPDYEDYIELLDQCVAQLEADIQIQKSVKEALGKEENEDSSEMDEEELQALLSELWKIGTEKSQLYAQVIALQSEWIEELQKEESSDTGQETGGDQTGTGQESGEGQLGAGQQNGQGERQENEGTSSEGENGQEQAGGDGAMPSGSSMSSGGGSISSGSGAGLSGADSLAASEAEGGSAGQMAGGMSLSEDEMSLFGDTYDLTQTKNLIEREPSDSENAAELVEQLKESRKMVQSQYEELTRDQKITELGIQYTYDTAIISGKLAEFTYQQELQQWEEQLAEAGAEKEELESEKALLDSMTDGILTADRDGLVAEISCEEGDVINGTEPVISYYNTDTVTITVEVPQEEITLLQVGDEASVTINGMLEREGVVTEKATEPESGTSRTTVNYEVVIEVDNSDGLLSSGAAARVTVSAERKETEQESGNE